MKEAKVNGLTVRNQLANYFASNLRGLNLWQLLVVNLYMIAALISFVAMLYFLLQGL